MNQSPIATLRILLLTLTMLVAAGRSAHADYEPLLLAPVATHALGDEEPEGPYSASTALVLPVAATAASAGLIYLGSSSESKSATTLGLVGLALGPSLGHAYTGHWGGVGLGMGIRAAGAGVAVMSVPVLLGTRSVETALTFAVAGGLVGVAGTAYSIIDAPFSAKRANKKHNQKLEGLTLTPAPIQGPSQSTGWGAQLAMTF